MTLEKIMPDDMNEVACAMLAYIGDEDKQAGAKMSYGDFGKLLAEDYGKNPHGVSGPDECSIETTRKSIRITTLSGNEYELTWNKAAKFIHPYLRSTISKTETVAPVQQPMHGLSTGTQSTQVSDSYAEAVTCHTAILSGIQLASQGLYQMAQGFKRMRDGKLYKELGYKSFEEYCEAETGIKRRQVYNYISIAEKLPAEFVQSTAQIGSEKLRLLTTLTDDQREEIAENTDLEQTSVKELQRKIKELTTDVEDLTIENDRLEKENQSLTFDNTNLEEERDDLIRQNNELMTRQPIVTGGIVTGGYDPEQLKEFFEDYYEAAYKAVRAVYIFVREDYPQEIKNYVRNRVNDLRNYIEDLEDIHEDDF